MSPEWRCHLNKGVPMEKFHCISFVPFTLLEGCVPVFPLEYQKVFSVKALAQMLYIYSCYVYNCVDSQVVFCRRHLINIQAHSSPNTPPLYVVRAYK